MKRMSFDKQQRVRSAVEGSAFGLQARAGNVAEDKGKTAHASGVTYTGGVLGHWFGDVVLDLQGMDPLPERGIPMLYGHFSPLGIWRSAEVTERGLEMTGEVIRAMPSAAAVLAGAEASFPWQMSVGADPIGPVSFYEKGEKATVNGREFAGPVTVFDRWRLAEASIVELGLDNQTEAAVAAARGDGAPRQVLSPLIEDKDMAVETAQTTAPPKTVDELRALAPQVAAQLEASAVETARKQEQARVASLMELAPDGSGPKVRGLVNEAIKAGKGVADIAAAVVKAAHEESTSVVETRTVKTKAKSEDAATDGDEEDDDEEEGDGDVEASDSDASEPDQSTAKSGVSAQKKRARMSANAEDVEQLEATGDGSLVYGEFASEDPWFQEPEEHKRLRAQFAKMPVSARSQYLGVDDYIGQRMLAKRGMLDRNASGVAEEGVRHARWMKEAR